MSFELGYVISVAFFIEMVLLNKFIEEKYCTSREPETNMFLEKKISLLSN
jgi:hypothetical protein